MVRSLGLALTLGIVSLVGACSSTDSDEGDESGGASTGGRGGSSGGKGGQTATGGASGAPAGVSGGGTHSGGTSGSTSGGSGGSTSGGSGGSTGSCVTETRVLEDLVMAGAGGQTDFTICDFNVPADVDENYINVFIGGSQLCWLASSQGCDRTPNGWWLNGGQILLCDAACSSYFDPEPDVPVSIQIGCESDTCL